jgi:hypothetical protein
VEAALWSQTDSNGVRLEDTYTQSDLYVGGDGKLLYS